MNETLEAMARLPESFQDWFVDFGPVRAKLAGREPYLPAGAVGAVPQPPGITRSSKGEIPEGWAVKALGEVATLNPALLWCAF